MKDILDERYVTPNVLQISQEIPLFLRPSFCHLVHTSSTLMAGVGYQRRWRAMPTAAATPVGDAQTSTPTRKQSTSKKKACNIGHCGLSKTILKNSFYNKKIQCICVYASLENRLL